MKFVLCALVLGALAVAGYAYSSGGPNAQLAGQDRLYGGGQISVGPGDSRNFGIDAHAESGGRAAFGDISYGGPVHDQHEQVTCLAVDGSKAAVGAVVTQADRPAVIGWWVLMFLADRGTPASGNPDQASLQYFGPPDPSGWPAGFPYTCPSPDTGAPDFGLVPSYLPFDGGDVVVQDAERQVTVPQGQPVRIALAGDSTGSGASFAAGIANAVKMAVEAHPAVRGFPIQIVPVNAPCGDAAADVQAARTITADAQNLAVLGQFCSSGFDQALPIYEAAGVVTITGSATNDALPSFGPTVFDRTAVDDGDGFDSWYAAVSQLPSDVDWQHAYAREFGTAPTQFADLYFDAASLLIRDLQKVSSPDGHGGLVIDRAALAAAVRGTTAFRGVTCTVTFDPKTGNRVNDPAALARCAASIE